jgi:dTDP-4-dehydrorhamnose 3,5-epimerase
MILVETPLPGAFVIELELRRDPRGFFARSYCRREFERSGLDLEMVQTNLSFNAKAGTLRGMHFQRPPAEESKLVRCSRGTIFDVIIDLRRDSATYGKHFAVELSDDSHRALFVPKGFAHGFQALSDEVMVEYQMGAYYSPNEATGIRYDDPAFAIEWPLPVTTISEQDLSWPRFRL